jgi:hypothetical protein
VARPAGEPSLSKLLAALGSAGLQKVVDDLHKTRVAWKRRVAEALSEFDAAMDGIESVKSAVAELVEKVVDFRDEYEKDSQGCAEFSIGVKGATMFQTIIEGPSGCGKTTLARHLAKVFFAAGLVKGGGPTSAKDPSEYFTEMQRGDAVTGYKDQAVVYLRDVVLTPNIGRKVVFIDEAPALCNGKDGKSADAESKAFVEELMKATQPAVESQRSLLILAGYGKRSSASDSSTTFEDVESANQGFIRRFSNILVVPQLEPCDIARIMVSQLKREHGLDLENKRRCPLYSADGLLTELVKARWDVSGDGKKPLRSLGAGFIADLVPSSRRGTASSTRSARVLRAKPT